MADTMVTKRNGYSLKGDLQPIIDGEIALPNYKPLDLEIAVGSIAASYGPGMRGSALIPGDRYGRWAQFFLDRGQGGGFHGSGVVLYWEDSKGKAASFAICDHKAIAGAGANPSRGWHPASCSKCGLDMSVDSGD
jgi:hypothetical protein